MEGSMSKCSSSVTYYAELLASLALAVPARSQIRSAYDRSTAIDKTSFVSWFPFIQRSVAVEVDEVEIEPIS